MSADATVEETACDDERAAGGVGVGGGGGEGDVDEGGLGGELEALLGEMQEGQKIEDDAAGRGATVMAREASPVHVEHNADGLASLEELLGEMQEQGPMERTHGGELTETCADDRRGDAKVVAVGASAAAAEDDGGEGGSPTPKQGLRPSQQPIAAFRTSQGGQPNAASNERRQRESSSCKEPRSGISIRRPLVPLVVLEERLDDRRGGMVFVPIKSLASSVIPEIVRMQSTASSSASMSHRDAGWASIAVLAERSQIRSTSSGDQKYVIWTLCDFKGSTVRVFLFGKAYEEHWKIEAGSVVLVCNMECMGQRSGGGERAAGLASRASFKIDGTRQAEKLGTCPDYTVCKGTRADGSRCMMGVHRRDEYCEFHLGQAMREMRERMLPSGRMELSSGNLMAALRGLGPGKAGKHQRGKIGHGYFGGGVKGRAAKPVKPASAAQLREISSMTAQTTAGKAGVSCAGGRGSRFLSSVADFVESKAGAVGADAGAGPMAATSALPSNGRAACPTSVPGLGNLVPSAAKYQPSVSLRKVDTKQMTFNSGTLLAHQPQQQQRFSRGGMSTAAGGIVQKGRKDKEATLVTSNGGLMRLPRNPGHYTVHGEKGRFDRVGNNNNSNSARGSAMELMELPVMPEGTSDPRALSQSTGTNDAGIAKILKALQNSSPPNPNVGTERTAERPTTTQKSAKRSQSADCGTSTQVVGATVQPSALMTKMQGARRSPPGAPVGVPSGCAAAEKPVKSAVACGKPVPSSNAKKKNSFTEAFGGVLNDGTNVKRPRSDQDNGRADDRRAVIDKQKSRYHGLHVSDKTLKMMETLERLQQREALSDKLDGVHEMVVRVHTCLDCKMTREKPANLCLENNHTIVSAKGIKRFFECRDCKRRTFSLNRKLPDVNCKRCGGNNYSKSGPPNAMAAAVAASAKNAIEADKLKARGDEHAFSLKQDLAS